MDRSQNIGGRRFHRYLIGAAHQGLGGQVENHLRAGRFHHPPDQALIADIAFDMAHRFGQAPPDKRALFLIGRQGQPRHLGAQMG